MLDYARRLAFAYSELSGSGNDGNTSLVINEPDRTDGLFAHFCIVVLRAADNALRVKMERVAMLLRGVLHVVALCAKEQVLGVDAGRVVAAVADQESFRDRAMMEFPRDAMGTITTRDFTRAHDTTVTTCVYSTIPYPATIGLDSMKPKTLLKGKGEARAVADATTKLTFTILDIAGPRDEGFTTDFALPSYGGATRPSQCGRLGMHGDLLSRCATPTDVPASRGHLHASIIAHSDSRMEV